MVANTFDDEKTADDATIKITRASKQIVRGLIRPPKDTSLGGIFLTLEVILHIFQHKEMYVLRTYRCLSLYTYDVTSTFLAIEQNEDEQ